MKQTRLFYILYVIVLALALYNSYMNMKTQEKYLHLLKEHNKLLQKHIDILKTL